MRPFLLLLLLASTAWADPAGYGHFNVLTVTSNNVTQNYPIRAVVDTATLVTAGKMQSNCNDLIFMGVDGTTQLKHWIETPTANTSLTSVWVKMPALANGNVTCTMWYSNATAAYTQDTTNTFLFCDEFSGSSIDTTKWPNDIGSGTYTVLGGTLTHTSTVATYKYTSNAYGPGTAFRMRASYDTGGGSLQDEAGFFRYSPMLYMVHEHRTTGAKFEIFDTGYVAGTVNYSSAFHTFDVLRPSGNSQSYLVDGTVSVTRSYAQGAEMGLRIWTRSGAGTVGARYDFILVRPCQTTEPTYAFAGEDVAPGSSSIKAVLGVPWADVKSVNGVPKASILKVLGVQ